MDKHLGLYYKHSKLQKNGPNRPRWQIPALKIYLLISLSYQMPLSYLNSKDP